MSEKTPPNGTLLTVHLDIKKIVLLVISAALPLFVQHVISTVYLGSARIAQAPGRLDLHDSILAHTIHIDDSIFRANDEYHKRTAFRTDTIWQELFHKR